MEQKEKDKTNWRHMSIMLVILLVITITAGIWAGLSWENDTNRMQAEIDALKSGQPAVQIIREKIPVKDEDVLAYLQARMDEFNSDKVHIIIDLDKWGAAKMEITTFSSGNTASIYRIHRQVPHGRSTEEKSPLERVEVSR